MAQRAALKGPFLMIHVYNLQKTYRIPEKDPGLMGSVKALFNRKYVDRHALSPISFDVGPGEIVGLLGANGAGKTTLIKMLAGIMHPTKGTAEVSGYIPWQRKSAFKQQIAIVLGQKSQLWPDLPAADSLLLLREIYGMPWDAYQRRLDFFLDTLDLRKLLKTQIRRLSLGERMKFELVAALLHEPKVIFLDEPTIGLDIGSQRAIRSFLNEYRQRFRPAMILTSHYMEDVEALCERLLILRDGELVYSGSLSNVSASYAQGRNIRLQLKDEAHRAVLISTFPKITESSEQLGLMRLHVHRDEVSDTVLRILNLVPVADLSVEEEDLANIIDSLQSNRGSK